VTLILRGTLNIGDAGPAGDNATFFESWLYRDDTGWRYPFKLDDPCGRDSFPADSEDRSHYRRSRDGDWWEPVKGCQVSQGLRRRDTASVIPIDRM